MEQLDSFKDWMQRHGITWDDGAIRFASAVSQVLGNRRETRSIKSATAMRHNSMGLGLSVHAARPIQEGEELGRIPKQSCITPSTCSISDLLEKELFGGGLALVLAVCHEQSLGTESKWHGYFLALPQREYLPIFWNHRQRQYLQGTMLCDKHSVLEAELQALRNDFTHLVKPFARKYKDRLRYEAWTFKNFQMAASLVASRAFGIDNSLGDGMVPLADAFNHKVSVVELAPQYVINGITDSDSDSQGVREKAVINKHSYSAKVHGDTFSEPPVLTDSAEFSVCGVNVCNELDLRLEIAIIDLGKDLQIVAASNIPCAGQEIHNTYGELSNVDLVKKYGFAIRDNPFATVVLDKSIVVEMAVDVSRKPPGGLGQTYCSSHKRKRDKLNKKRASTSELIAFIKSETELLEDDEEPFEVMVNGHIGPALFMTLFILCWDGDVSSLKLAMGEVLEAEGGAIGPVGLRPALDAKSKSKLKGSGDILQNLVSLPMCTVLQMAATEQLSKYPTTLTETLEEIEECTARFDVGKELDGAEQEEYSAVIAALTLRASEQQLLHDLIEAVKSRCQSLG